LEPEFTPLRKEINNMENDIDTMKACNQRVLGGSLLFIKSHWDCLTIRRGNTGMPQVESIEGEFTEGEIQAALSLYEGTEAAQR
jgi:hypothetical protein